MRKPVYRRYKIVQLIIVSLFVVGLKAEDVLPEMRGVWLSRNVIMQGRESIRQCFSELKESRFNTVFVDVWYRGGTIYPSGILEEYGGLSQLADYSGWDPLTVAIEEGHRIGLEVHAWFEYGLIGHFTDSISAPDPGPILGTRSRLEWLMTDRDGHNYAIGGWGNYQFWLDPAHEDAVDFIVKLFEECARNYPDLDGIQTDRIRYPNPDFSFSEISCQKYQIETGGSDPLTISADDPEWADFTQWRERKVSDLAKLIYQGIKSINPSLLVSSSVGPPYMLDGDDDKLQDWPTWYAEHSIDLLCPMLYGLQSDMAYWLDKCLAEADAPLRIAPGIDINGASNETLSNTFKILRNKHFAGSVIWYYGDLNAENLAGFRDEFYFEKISSINQMVIVDDNIRQYVDSLQMESRIGGFRGQYHTGNSESRFAWQIPVLVSDDYSIDVYIPNEWNESDSLNYRLYINNDSLDLTVSTRLPTWVKIHQQFLNYDDTLRIKMLGSNTGNIVADAVKIKRKKSLEIIEGFTPTRDSLQLRFNSLLNIELLNIEQFQIKPGIQIYSVSGDMKNQVIVTLNCSDFVPETDYQLKAWSLEKWDGTKSDTLFFQFRYVPGQIAVIDNEDPLFTVQSGDWQMDSSAAKFYGNNYVKTPCGDGTARVFWRYQVPISGYYRVMALFPDSTAFATDAMYLLKKGTEFDTIRVDQTKQLTNSVILGDIWADDGSYIVVKLHNQSGESLEHWVVADAIRISRIFYGTGIDRDDKLQKPDFIRLFPNYPNPFNSSTKIEYEIQFSSKVQLRIYDLTGRLTRQIEQYSGPGRYSFQVDCANLPSGIYLYQVVAGKHILTGKMMVLR